jgi:hypothetical protein
VDAHSEVISYTFVLSPDCPEIDRGGYSIVAAKHWPERDHLPMLGRNVQDYLPDSSPIP